MLDLDRKIVFMPWHNCDAMFCPIDFFRHFFSIYILNLLFRQCLGYVLFRKCD